MIQYFSLSSTDPIEPVDLVVFAAHPDDAELNCGGLLLISKLRGWKTAIVDATQGELGSLGTAELRREEAEQAARCLQLNSRFNLGFPDGDVRDTQENRQTVISIIRKLQPKLVIAPPRDDHHPDHSALGQLIERSFYLTGIKKLCPEIPTHRPNALLFHGGTRPFEPDAVVDVTPVIEKRKEAILCFQSQFKPKEEASGIRIASDYFMDSVEGRLRYFGSLIGVPFGEPYTSLNPLPVKDLVAQFEEEPWKAR